MVLTEANFDKALEDNSLMLVEFYAPWCGHCKSLAPEWSKAAKKLNAENSPMKLAKVDATEEKSLGSKFEIKGFPTIKFFKNGKPTEYNGGRTEPEILKWVEKKSGPSYKTITSEDDLTKFQEANDVFALGVFSSLDSIAAKVYTAYAADQDEGVNFAVTTEKVVMTKLALSADTIVVLKNFDDLRADLPVTDNFDSTTLSNFVNGESIPLLQTFSQESSRQIFSSPIKKHVLIFTNKDKDHHKSTFDVSSQVAKEFKGKLLMVNVPSSESRVMEFFDLKEEHLPKIIISDMSEEGGIKKYPYSGDINAASLTSYFGEFFDNKLKPVLKSEEPAPEDKAGDVIILKGKSFNEIVIDNEKDVLVEFYAPWCGHCKKLAPIWDELGAKFKSHDDIVIAKMDSTANEIDVSGVNVRGFPTIYFFKGNDKSNPVKYEEGRELKDFVEFLKKSTHNTVKHDEL